jgi:hypothetical protein
MSARSTDTTLQAMQKVLGEPVAAGLSDSQWVREAESVAKSGRWEAANSCGAYGARLCRPALWHTIGTLAAPKCHLAPRLRTTKSLCLIWTPPRWRVTSSFRHRGAVAVLYPAYICSASTLRGPDEIR